MTWLSSTLLSILYTRDTASPCPPLSRLGQRRLRFVGLLQRGDHVHRADQGALDGRTSLHRLDEVRLLLAERSRGVIFDCNPAVAGARILLGCHAEEHRQNATGHQIHPARHAPSRSLTR